MKYYKAYILGPIVFIMLVTMGTALAVPTTIDDRTEYSTALNSVASVMMNWYGSLITNSGEATDNVAFNTSYINDKLLSYRSKYPKNISQIIITDSKLLKLSIGNNYQFKVKSKITYITNNKKQTQALDETFVINGSLLNRQNVTPIKSIHMDKKEKTETPETSQYNRSHYKVREFTYAWLAYIDGIETLKPTMNSNAWLDKATYSLNIGAKQIEDSITTALEKKKKLLTKGGHLLRSLDVKKETDNPSIFVVDLILEWKGTNLTGTPVVAKIHQEIQVKITADKQWEVISIKEKHLLPIIAPWMGLVC